ncbi:MAG: PIN domain-containing protein [Desulfomicrobium sp.]|jgi:predicted nucleic acid-binding protein|nr:PIN domain-containing protein [Desulfomicrobium sp.]
MKAALDTNILAYAEGCGDERRCSLALRLIEELPSERIVLPAQTLGELFRVLTGKMHRTPEEAKTAILNWTDSFEIADSTATAFQSAFDLVVDHGLPMWDSLIMAVAAENQCRVLFSEDFQNGFTWRGVTVVNPFTEPRSALHSILTSAKSD